VGGDICLDSVNGRSFFFFFGAGNGLFPLVQGLLFQHGFQWRSLVHPCPPGRFLIFFFHASFRFFLFYRRPYFDPDIMALGLAKAKPTVRVPGTKERCYNEHWAGTGQFDSDSF
jgi:hypothetical protein